MKKKISVVLGMHRSGTSLITRSLSTLGFQLGDNLMQSVKGNNDKGFWEDLDIYELNEEMLKYCNKAWWSIEPISSQDINNLTQSGFQTRAIKLIENKTKAVTLLGLKDPRISKLFKFWSRIFEKVDAEVTYICALRNPISVADSLYERDKIEACHSYMAYVDHYLSILGSIKSKKWIKVEYEKMIENPDEELEKISELTGQAKDPVKLQEFKTNFIDRKLQHTLYNLEDCENQSVPTLCKEIYKYLADFQINRPTTNSSFDFKIIGRFEKDFKDLTPTIKIHDMYTKKTFDYENERVISINAISEANAVTQQAQAEAQQARAEAQQAQAEVQQAQAEVQQAQAEVQQAQAEVQQALAEVQQAQAEVQQALAEAEQQRQIIKEIKGSTSWKITFIARRLIDTKKRLGKIIKNAVRQKQRSTRSRLEAKEIARSGLFDNDYYLTMYPDIQAASLDPILHYCKFGWREGRNPSDDFDTLTYLQINSDIRDADMNPFWHYVKHGALEQRQATPMDTIRYENNIAFQEIKSDIQVIAYYANIENNLRNYSPNNTQIPHPLVSKNQNLGHNNKLDVLATQAKLAKQHGISTWCFTLSIDGQNQNENALTNFLLNTQIDISFILELNISTPLEKIDTHTLATILSAIRDDRYLALNEKPALVINGNHYSSATHSALQKLRTYLSSNNISSPYIILRSNSSLAEATTKVAKFTPNAILIDHAGNLTKTQSKNIRHRLKNGIKSIPYSMIVAKALRELKLYESRAISIYSTITPGYDDSLVNIDNPICFSRPTIKDFRLWLDSTITDLRANHLSDRRLLFLRSWNDWNRGTMLEPDCNIGYRRLNEISRALLDRPSNIALPKVSVIVPNYNHSDYLSQRLDCIYKQTYPNIEIMLLDDASTDNSQTILKSYADLYPEITRTCFNQSNSGSVFEQWAKGIHLATGELIWIAESDDYCAENFLETLVRCFEDEAVMLAYAQTEFVQADGSTLPNEFFNYVRDLACREKWTSSYIKTAHQEVAESLGIINTIPNASGVVFRKPVDMPLLRDKTWLSMRIAGDWVFYLNLLRGGKIAYSTETTNYFRRYKGSAAETTYGKKSFFSEVTYALETVHSFYDVPKSVVQQAEIIFKRHFKFYVGDNEFKFLEWFDIQSISKAANKRTPNIIISTQGFSPGGAEILPIRMANEFKRQGHAVTLLSAGMGQYEYGVRKMLRADIPMVETSNIKETKKLLDDLGIEVLNSHQWHIQKYPTKVPNVFTGLKAHLATLHGMVEYGDAFGVTTEQIKTADQNVSTWIYTADKNIVPFLEQGIYEENSPRFVKLPNGIEPPTIQPIQRSDLGIPENAFVLCCVSRAIPEKGWDEVINAVSQAREISGKDIHLILVGNGPIYDEYCSKGVPPFVYLAGFNANSVGFYAASDMGIMLTHFRSESFPLTIVDCLFAQRPFVATSVGEIRNMLETSTGFAGKVIELDNWKVPVKKVAQVIAQFADNQTLYQSAKDSAIKASSRFNIENVIKQYIEVISRDIAINTSLLQ